MNVRVYRTAYARNLAIAAEVRDHEKNPHLHPPTNIYSNNTRTGQKLLQQVCRNIDTIMTTTTPPPTEHTYIALRIEPASPTDPTLHVTLTFIEDATRAERLEVWKIYTKFFSRHLPIPLALGNKIKVGPANDLDAREMLLDYATLSELEDMYKRTKRRANGAIPDLLLHMTTSSDAKRAAAEKLPEQVVCSTLFMATVGKHKRVVVELTQHEELGEAGGVDGTAGKEQKKRKK